jgi:gas vesicle protein
MSSEDSGSGFLSGFLLGGLVGAAVALLLTPRSGEENRENLLDKSIELKSRAEVVASKAAEEADSLPARLKVVLEEQKSRVQDAIEEGKESAAQKRAEMLDKYRVSKQTGEAPLPGEPPRPVQEPPRVEPLPPIEEPGTGKT